MTSYLGNLNFLYVQNSCNILIGHEIKMLVKRKQKRYKELEAPK